MVVCAFLPYLCVCVYGPCCLKQKLDDDYYYYYYTSGRVLYETAEWQVTKCTVQCDTV